MATPITDEQRKQYIEDGEKAVLLKESLKIVDELAKFEIGYSMDDYDPEELERLVDKAKKLTKHRLWRL